MPAEHECDSKTSRHSTASTSCRWVWYALGIVVFIIGAGTGFTAAEQPLSIYSNFSKPQLLALSMFDDTVLKEFSNIVR